jgi:hypothetical protein
MCWCAVVLGVLRLVCCVCWCAAVLGVLTCLVCWVCWGVLGVLVFWCAGCAGVMRAWCAGCARESVPGVLGALGVLMRGRARGCVVVTCLCVVVCVGVCVCMWWDVLIANISVGYGFIPQEFD